MCLAFSVLQSTLQTCLGVCVCSFHSLCCFKGHLKVLPAIARAESGVVKGLREEVVHQSTEGHPITPAGGEVLNIYVLRQQTKKKQTDKTKSLKSHIHKTTQFLSSVAL